MRPQLGTNQPVIPTGVTGRSPLPANKPFWELRWVLVSDKPEETQESTAEESQVSESTSDWDMQHMLSGQRLSIWWQHSCMKICTTTDRTERALAAVSNTPWSARLSPETPVAVNIR